jgi:hypothetical protein
MRKQTLSAAVVGSLVALLVASGLAVSAGAEQPGDGARRGYNRLQLTRAPTPTATPGPSGGVVRVRHGAPPNALVGLSSSFGAGGSGPGCGEEALVGTSAYWNGCIPISSGETVLVQSLSEIMGMRMRTCPFMEDVTTENLPTIWSTDPIPEGGAFAESPTGKRLLPIFRDRGGTFTVQLPLEAFGQPGLWHLVVVQPAFYEIRIEIPRPDAPFCLYDGSRTDNPTPPWIPGPYLIGGFASLERVKGVIFDNGGMQLPARFVGDFDFQVDENGYTLIDLDWNVAGDLFFLGEYGHAVVSTGFIEKDGANISSDEFERLLYDTYWGGGVSPEIVITASAANFRSWPGLDSEVIGWGQGGERYPAIGRRESWEDNRVWYKILLPDGTAAWISGRIVEVVPSADTIPCVFE